MPRKRMIEYWAIFTTHYRSRRLLRGMSPMEYWARRGPNEIVAQLPRGSTLTDAIVRAREHYVTSSDPRFGIVQVQGPAGIWFHVNGLGNLTVARPELVGFASWAELERDEYAADNPLTRAMDLHGAMDRARAAAALDTARRVDRLTLAQLAAVDGCGSLLVTDLIAAARR